MLHELWFEKLYVAMPVGVHVFCECVVDVPVVEVEVRFCVVRVERRDALVVTVRVSVA